MNSFNVSDSTVNSRKKPKNSFIGLAYKEAALAVVLNLSKQCCFTTQNTAVVYHCFSDSEHFFCCCCSSRTTGRLFVLAGINRSIDDAHPARPLCGRPVAQQPSRPAQSSPAWALLRPPQHAGPAQQESHALHLKAFSWHSSEL